MRSSSGSTLAVSLDLLDCRNISSILKGKAVLSIKIILAVEGLFTAFLLFLFLWGSRRSDYDNNEQGASKLALN